MAVFSTQGNYLSLQTARPDLLSLANKKPNDILPVWQKGIVNKVINDRMPWWEVNFSLDFNAHFFHSTQLQTVLQM